MYGISAQQTSCMLFMRCWLVIALKKQSLENCHDFAKAEAINLLERPSCMESKSGDVCMLCMSMLSVPEAWDLAASSTGNSQHHFRMQGSTCFGCMHARHVVLVASLLEAVPAPSTCHASSRAAMLGNEATGVLACMGARESSPTVHWSSAQFRKILHSSA